MSVLPKYPVYVPSKGRFETGLTMKCLLRDRVPFYLVVEPQEAEAYRSRYPGAKLLILPWSGNDETRQRFCAERGIENGGLIAVRNWCKEHSIRLGAARHWQIDDNISNFWRWYRGIRLYCAAGPALRASEDFVDRFENVAIAGLNYVMFAVEASKPFVRNAHVYSCTLVLNSIPHRWRLAYNDDTDICLQVLSDGWCTVQINAFLIQKLATMLVAGGNTADLYQGDGRLRMARSLERAWPGVVTTKRRFGRPQHVITYNWRKFDTPLRLKPEFVGKKWAPNEYGLKLTAVAEVKSPRLRELLKQAP